MLSGALDSTHRVAISNSRLLSVDDGVRFKTKDGKTATLTHHEFIRRFLQHVLPKNFVKIRHFGLMSAANAKTKLEVARKLLEGQSASEENNEDREDSDTSKDWRERYEELTGIDLSRCPKCEQGTMNRFSLDEFQEALCPFEDTS